MLHCFKGEDFINVEGGYNYWGNCCGDIFNPFTGKDLTIEDLPIELQRAYTELWCEGAGARCYPIQFKGKYGISLELEYEDDWLDDIDFLHTHEELIAFAKKKAEKYTEKYPEYEVVFGEESLVWFSYGVIDSEASTIVSIIIPWDATHEEVIAVADDMYNTGYNYIQDDVRIQKSMLIFPERKK